MKKRNGGIRRGWFPEEPEQFDEIRGLGASLLKSKLDEVFKIIAQKHKEYIASREEK